ncbi:hypothetical protein L486_05828 [Kwoniella mangroviensis CBS 10435]|uniref:Uncharacterized protein n=1 Tax=Kwoniella mangroviensis CBS 10435 TaxID=1331196 RepID=A0A1B9IN22_9TREE|nr:hypothetical protein L486_05828 [Kwoniella mangroviensis CBS 10435]
MVFTLPSLPSRLLGGLIDTSPPVFYPPTRNTPTKPPRTRSRSRSSAHDQIDSPIQTIPPSPSLTPVKQTQPYPGLGNLLPASASVTDLTGDWAPLPGGGLGEKRRLSISSAASHGYGHNSRPNSPPPSNTRLKTPTRPTHRRCHSALPASSSSSSSIAFSLPQTTGKLQEFSISRNPLASTSAISLPTLIEGQGEPSTSHRSVPASPLINPHSRKPSKSKISPISPNLPLEEESEFEDNPIPELKFTKASLERSNSNSSVPPPNHSYSCSYQSMPPPPLRPDPINMTYSPSSSSKNRKIKPLIRPIASPRSWSVQDIHSLTGGTSRKGLHSRRGSIESTSSVSDIAVLATWSFPNTPPKNNQKEVDPDPSDTSRGRKSGPSERLKERLKNIPGIETGSFQFPSSGSLPSLPKPLVPLPLGVDGNPIKPSRPLPSHLNGVGHRHTHSSPNLINIPTSTSTPTRQAHGQMGPPAIPPTSNPLFLPPKPVQRRPTTSRLRQPNPLSMSTHQNQPSLVGGKELGSSPGSIGSLSDTSTLCPSPTTSVKSLPPLSADADSIAYTNTHGKAWWSFTSFKRSNSYSSERSDDQKEKGREEEDEDDGVEVLSKLVMGTEQDWESDSNGIRTRMKEHEEEEYIDLDNM